MHQSTTGTASGKENDRYGENCSLAADQPAKNPAVAKAVNQQTFSYSSDARAKRNEAQNSAHQFLASSDDVNGAFATDADTSIFDEQFVLLADGSGKGRDQQELRKSKAQLGASGKVSSNMFYMKNMGTEAHPEDQGERMGLFSAG